MPVPAPAEQPVRAECPDPPQGGSTGASKTPPRPPRLLTRAVDPASRSPRAGPVPANSGDEHRREDEYLLRLRRVRRGGVGDHGVERESVSLRAVLDQVDACHGWV